MSSADPPSSEENGPSTLELLRDEIDAQEHTTQARTTLEVPRDALELPRRARGSRPTPRAFPTPASPANLVLEAVAGPDWGKRFESKRAEVLLGSAPSCSFRLAEDDTVAPEHCVLRLTPEGVRVRDLDTPGGTFVDGVRVHDAWLRPGASLRVGHSTLVYREAAAEHDEAPENFGTLHGRSPKMHAVFETLAKSARSAATVLVEGETGTGKEGAARSIHDASPRRDRSFVVVDCGAIPENLIESELFGHERGAFTGATTSRRGAFEEADQGTIFLDEIGELPMDLQPKLLRVLEARTIRRVGSTSHKAVDVRVIAATNRDLRDEVDAGSFRSDLYYRLAVIRVVLPPLRERPEDFPVLVRVLLERLGASPAQLERFTAEGFLTRVRAAHWPGNVRELRNYLERCVVLDTEISLHDRGPRRGPELDVNVQLPFQEARQELLREFERRYLEELLARHATVSAAADAAGLHRVYLHRLMKKHGKRR